MIELIGLLPSTAHLRFFIMGTFPVAFRSMSTTDKNRKFKWNPFNGRTNYLLLVDVDCLSAVGSIDDSRSIDISFLSSPGASIVYHIIKIKLQNFATNCSLDSDNVFISLSKKMRAFNNDCCKFLMKIKIGLPFQPCHTLQIFDEKRFFSENSKFCKLTKRLVR